jgi:hypothetical protein
MLGSPQEQPLFEPGVRLECWCPLLTSFPILDTGFGLGIGPEALSFFLQPLYEPDIRLGCWRPLLTSVPILGVGFVPGIEIEARFCFLTLTRTDFRIGVLVPAIDILADTRFSVRFRDYNRNQFVL